MMAASAEDEQTEDLGTCHICMEYYNETENLPKHLPCGHAFCCNCLKVTKPSKLYFTLLNFLNFHIANI